MGESQTAYLCSVLLAFIGLIATAIVHAFGYLTNGVQWDIFDNSLEETWESYNLRIIVPEWFFWIWMIIYAMQILWIAYGLAALCKKSKQGWLSEHPPILPSVMYVMMLMGLACNLGWVVVFDMREHVTYSVMACSGAAIFYTITLGISVFSVKKYGTVLRHEGHGCDVTYIQIFLHNAVAALSSWLPCITFYVVAVILHSKDILERETAQYVVLGITMSYCLIWLVVDICGFGVVTSHIFTPYVIYLLAFVMPLYQNWEEENRDALFTVAIILTCVGGFLLLAKISVNLGRMCARDVKVVKDDFEGGAVEYQEPDYDYEKEHDNSQLGLVHY